MYYNLAFLSIKKNTYEWYAKRVYKINDDAQYNPADKLSAYQKAAEWGDKIPIGILYKIDKETYEDKSGINKLPPLVDENIESIDITNILNDFV